MSKEGVQEFRMEIGGIVISIISDNEKFEVIDTYRLFESDKTPDVTLRVRYGEIPCCNLEERIYQFDAVGSLYRAKGKVCLFIQGLGDNPCKLAIFESDLRYNQIYIESRQHSSRYHPFPLDQLLSKFLIINLLSLRLGRLGVMVHAAGVDDDDLGIIFAGRSGVGKTTMASLWKGSGATILGDDNIIIRCMKGDFLMYGTPWGRGTELLSTRVTKLHRIFFIRHSQNNFVRPLKGVESVEALYTHTFGSLYYNSDVHFTLNFLIELVENVDCYELGFIPDKHVVDFVRGIK